MAIPGSGKVSIGDIRTELQNGGTNNFSLKKAGRPTTGVPGTFENPVYTPVNQSSSVKPNNSQPYSISEWRNYNHTENLACSSSSYISPPLGIFYTYYRFQISGGVNDRSNIFIQGSGTSNHWCYIYLSYPFNNVGQVAASPWTYSFFSADTTKVFVRDIQNTTEVLHILIYQDGN